MKRFLLLLCLPALLALVVSCGEEDPEEVADLEYDYVTTDDGQLPDNDTAEQEAWDEDTTEEESGDDATVVPDNTPVCGNMSIEAGERCDIAPSDCAKITPGLTGIANCKGNCLGWAMNECTKNTEVWGVATLDFYTEYILDDSRMGDPVYREQGLQRYDAFYGLYGDNVPFPPVAATDTWSAASTVPAGGGNYTTFVRQHSFVGTSELYPYLELEFPPGVIAQAEYSVNSTDTIFFNKKMVRFRIVGTSGNAPCVVAMGFWGTVHVDQAWQSSPIEGGRLALVASTIEFYPPRQLPNLALEEGDPLPDDLLEIMKYPECP